VNDQPNQETTRRFNISRRSFIVSGGGAAVALMAGGVYAGTSDVPERGKAPAGLRTTDVPTYVRQKAFSVSDGWVGMPNGLPAIPPYFPDTLAGDDFTTYVFGFRDVTGLNRTQVEAQAGKAQVSAPLLEVSVGEELWLTLSNLGLLTRPDLVDSHTLHWHGFRNAIPYYDGVPETSISVPIGRDFTYVYRPLDAGTYMYHCHFEDVEHVTMGMTGIIFVRPEGHPKWAYDDPTTEFVREYAILLTEFDLAGHWNDAHIQTSDWTSYKPNVWLMNGRAYPDTLAPNSSRSETGDMDVPAEPHLQYQPNSSKIKAAPGEKVLIRLANLGFQEQTLTMPGVPLVTVGSDARLLGVEQRTTSDTVVLGPGESRDILITAPAVGVYPFYNTDPMKYRGTATDQWVGGQRTELVVQASLPAQTAANQWEA
jgi:FtsP/CotA-like multicopper oxidase with cupredoxin domain